MFIDIIYVMRYRALAAFALIVLGISSDRAAAHDFQIKATPTAIGGPAELATVITRVTSIGPLDFAQLTPNSADTPREAVSAQGKAVKLESPKPWMFFDLGENTLVRTPENPITHDLENIQYMPGAQEYLQNLSKRGYPLGLLVNWPPEEGGIDALKQYISERWIDRSLFDWSLFKAGIFLSTTMDERKPLLPLFNKAVELARTAGCKVIYQGSLPDEVIAAKKAGMAAYHVGDKGKPFYLPETDIINFAERNP